jgi:hypothetical protein
VYLANVNLAASIVSCDGLKVTAFISTVDRRSTFRRSTHSKFHNDNLVFECDRRPTNLQCKLNLVESSSPVVGHKGPAAMAFIDESNMANRCPVHGPLMLPTGPMKHLLMSKYISNILLTWTTLDCQELGIPSMYLAT